eukprot:gene9372-6591_t
MGVQCVGCRVLFFIFIFKPSHKELNRVPHIYTHTHHQWIRGYKCNDAHNNKQKDTTEGLAEASPINIYI